MRTVMVDKRGAWTFSGEHRYWDGAYSLVVKESDLAKCRASDLAWALRRAREWGDEPSHVNVDSAPDDEYSPKESVAQPTSFFLTDDGDLALRVSITSDRYYDNDAEISAVYLPLLAPLKDRLRVKSLWLEADGYRSTAPYVAEMTLVVALRGHTLLDLFEVGEEFRTLCAVVDTGAFTARAVTDLVVAGSPQLLVGQPEGPWFDAKSDHYELSALRGKLALAQSVARFCNAEDGGVVIVGLSTKRVPGGEVVKAVTPVPLDGAVVRRYRQTIEHHLYPFPEGMYLRAVHTSPTEGLMAIYVPPQNEELRPFLVHGAIVGDKCEGAFISIVRRSGEDSIPITASQIHSQLAAGRALLRRGVLPAPGQ